MTGPEAVSLREHLEAKIAALQANLGLELRQIGQDVTEHKAQSAAEYRLLRDDMKDLRSEVAQLHDAEGARKASFSTLAKVAIGLVTLANIAFAVAGLLLRIG